MFACFILLCPHIYPRFCVCVCGLQVKIKKKYELVTKQIDPVIENDDFKNAATTEGDFMPLYFAISCISLKFGSSSYLLQHVLVKIYCHYSL